MSPEGGGAMKALLQHLRRLFTSRHDRSDELAESDSAAHPADETPEEVHPGRPNIKQSYTSHWDLDYMPREEMERLFEEGKKSRKEDDGD